MNREKMAWELLLAHIQSKGLNVTQFQDFIQNGTHEEVKKREEKDGENLELEIVRRYDLGFKFDGDQLNRDSDYADNNLYSPHPADYDPDYGGIKYEFHRLKDALKFIEEAVLGDSKYDVYDEEID